MFLWRFSTHLLHLERIFQPFYLLHSFQDHLLDIYNLRMYNDDTNIPSLFIITSYHL